MEAGKSGKARMVNNFDFLDINVLKEKLSDVVNKALYEEPTNKTKIYFAGPWFDERAMVLYQCCEKIMTKLENDCGIYVFFPKNAVSKTPLEAFERNVKEIQECDILIALVSRKDVGTAWEIGVAYALGKPIYLLGFDETTFLSHTNVMLAFTGKCLTIDNLKMFLEYKDIPEQRFVHIKNEWEGIE